MSEKEMWHSTEAFLVNAKIRHMTPASLEYESLRQAYSASHDQPFVIVRPRTAAEVSTLLKHCRAKSIPFVVRAGGHDLFGRSTLHGGLTIDLRDINYVHVNHDKKTARIGGGIIFSKLLEDLARHNLHVPTGTVGTVGFVGWAMGGGYGDSCAWAGLGLDQILRAKVVNANGELMDADDEMLKGIRGSGGFGIIVEATIQVYAFKEIQAGQLFFDTTKDLKSTVVSVLSNFSQLTATDPLPPNLTCQLMIFGMPGKGHLFICGFSWRGSRGDEFKSWLSKIAAIGPLANDPMEAVRTTTAAATIDNLTAILAPSIWTHSQTVSFTHLSAEVIEIFAEHAIRLPLTGGGLSFHELRRCSPSSGPLCQFPNSVFAARMPHIMLEIIAGSMTEEESRATNQWALDCRNALIKLNASLPITYLALTPPEYVNIDRMYGENASELRRLRRKFDPEGVFKHAVPKMS